jgi:2-polyprenyl-3-methyl-5-hydroxy-6-metoxy-1,4-benzoquinol methylase
MSTATGMALDMDKLNAFVGRAVGDLGAAMHAALIVIGDRLGLYRAMSDSKPVTSSELAQRTGTAERYIREWLNANAASGYVEYDASTKTYRLPPEQAFALALDNTPVHLPGAFLMVEAIMRDIAPLMERFRTGKGLGWHEHHESLFEGCERFFRPNYLGNLVTSWIPALNGVEAKLKAGAKVADVGCGHGASTILMAQSYPQSHFYGFDYHEPSIQNARKAAKAAGVSDRTTFDVAPAKSFPGKDYDFVAFFDCLHDMGDPEGAARHVKQALKADGVWMIVEPFANDETERNLNPVGRVFYSASTLICTPASLSQEVGLALGAQAGPARIESVIRKAGFQGFRKATETPFNMVFEAKP